MNVPNYAKPAYDHYQKTGTLPGQTEKRKMDRQDAEERLVQMKDEFTHWQQLDETDADLAKGKPGEVRVAGSMDPQGGTTAVFQGDTQNGQLEVFQNEPNMHYSYTGFSATRFTPQSAEQFSTMHSDVSGHTLSPSLTHVDRQLASDGPVDLVGGPVTITLKDHAQGGYSVWSKE